MQVVGLNTERHFWAKLKFLSKNFWDSNCVAAVPDNVVDRKRQNVRGNIAGRVFARRTY